MKTLRQLQDEIRVYETPEPPKAVVFMFGRFNPPTLGHEKMVETAVRVARKFGIREVRLYASYSQDSKKNPILHEDKIKWLRKFFTDVTVVEDTDARSPFDVARKLSEEGVQRVVMVAGGDRASEFQYRIGKYINHPDPEKSFTFEHFQVVSGGGRDPDADDASGVSASKMREFAADADFGSFIKGLPTLANLRDGKELFEAIRRGMNLGESGLVLDERITRINEDFKLLTEASISTVVKWWYNIKGNKFVKVDTRQETNHDWAPIVFPERFGLKNSNVVKFRGDMERGNEEIEGIRKLMFAKGWARASVVGATFMAEAKTLEDATAVLRALVKKLPRDPDVIFADYAQGPTQPGGGRFINLTGIQIRTFIKTGKVAQKSKLGAFRDHVELDEQRTVNWWYNVSRNKFFVVQRTELHADALRNRFRDFGLKESDVKRLGLIPFMLSKGWARVVVESGGGAWDIETKDLNFAWKTAAAMDKKFGQPSKIFVGQRDLALQGNQVRAFIRTGKIVQLSKLAAFREYHQLELFGEDFKLEVARDDESHSFK